MVSTQHIKLLFVAGTRPNFMKVAPLLKACKKFKQVTAFLVHTGQHYDPLLSEVFFRQLQIDTPDLKLEAGKYLDYNEQICYIRDQIIARYTNKKLTAIVVVGDVNSTVGGALAGEALKIPVAHVEAGLRSFDDRMPEEHNRIRTDEIATIYFVTEPSGCRNLQNKRFHLEKKKLFLVGNIMIDTLLEALPAARALQHYKTLGLKRKKYVLFTFHRKENLETPTCVANVLRGIRTIAKTLPVCWPIHPRTEKFLRNKGLYNEIVTSPNIKVIPPLGYLENISVAEASLCVVTDSGGMQDETTALGIPCLTVRKSTERPITASVGSSTIVGCDYNKLVRQFRRVQQGTYKTSRNPHLWDGGAAERIIKHLRDCL